MALRLFPPYVSATIRPGANSTWQLGGQTLLREYPITLPNEWTGEGSTNRASVQIHELDGAGE